MTLALKDEMDGVEEIPGGRFRLNNGQELGTQVKRIRKGGS